MKYLGPTFKIAFKYMPNSIVTAKGHMNRIFYDLNAFTSFHKVGPVRYDDVILDTVK